MSKACSSATCLCVQISKGRLSGMCLEGKTEREAGLEIGMEPLTWTKKDYQNEVITNGCGLFNLITVALPCNFTAMVETLLAHPQHPEGIHPLPSSIFFSCIPVAAYVQYSERFLYF